MTKQRTQREEDALKVYYYAASLIKAGQTEGQVIQALMDQGVRQQTAHIIMDKLSEARTNVSRRTFRRMMFMGGVVIAFGAWLWLSLDAQAPVLATVAALLVMAAGGWQFLRGLARYLRLERLYGKRQP